MKFVDKNGNELKAGQRVRKVGSFADYNSTNIYLVCEQDLNLIIDGETVGYYHTSNGFTTLEIVSDK
jgi:hypothetical protein